MPYYEKRCISLKIISLLPFDTCLISTHLRYWLRCLPDHNWISSVVWNICAELPESSFVADTFSLGRSMFSVGRVLNHPAVLIESQPGSSTFHLSLTNRRNAFLAFRDKPKTVVTCSISCKAWLMVFPRACLIVGSPELLVFVGPTFNTAEPSRLPDGWVVNKLPVWDCPSD